MKLWSRFWNWYEKRVLSSLTITAIILYLQIPHTWTAAECFFGGSSFLFGHHFITDFLLYGIDLLELIPIIAITGQIYAQVRKKRKN